MVSLKRLSEFIKMDKIDLANYYCSAEEVEVDEATKCESVIIIEDATFSHSSSDLIAPDDQTFKLDHINVVVKKGELVGIVGKVGSGKSSFLNCVMVSVQRYYIYQVSQQVLDRNLAENLKISRKAKKICESLFTF